MKHYGNIEIAEGAKITNATIAHGTSFPSNPNEGEMFWRSDENKLYVYDETTPGWLATSGGLQNIVEDTTPQLGGDLDAQTNKITNLEDPTSLQDASTKAYTDNTAIAMAIALG